MLYRSTLLGSVDFPWVHVHPVMELNGIVSTDRSIYVFLLGKQGTFLTPWGDIPLVSDCTYSEHFFVEFIEFAC